MNQSPNRGSDKVIVSSIIDVDAVVRLDRMSKNLGISRSALIESLSAPDHLRNEAKKRREEVSDA